MSNQKESKKYSCKYRNKFKRSHTISEIKNVYVTNKNETHFFSISGRIFRKRIMGKATFLELKDESGKIQLYLAEKNLFDYKEIVNYIVLGDIIYTKGSLFMTKTNELSVNVIEIEILAKNINTFPDKRFGLLDKDICYRQRYLDLIINNETKKIFEIRSKIISQIRDFFHKLNYIEVETPIIQNITGGADAKPFETYNNYMDSKLYLRISPELHLKRLIIGGFEKIFEIGKNFRNEGVSNRHHPEFTTIEFYEAYSTYKDLMILTEKLINNIAKFLLETKLIKENNKLQNLFKPFEKISFHDAITQYTKISINEINEKENLINILKKENIKIDETLSLAKIQTKVFEHFVEKNLLEPTFILYHPLDVSPLSRQCDTNTSLVERFELYIDGKELANGFSELNDPIEQEKRFKSQIKNKDIDIEYDKDYINALKYALPPTAGEGIGIDRLVMLFTNSKSIKDVILFPLMKFK